MEGLTTQLERYCEGVSAVFSIEGWAGGGNVLEGFGSDAAWAEVDWGTYSVPDDVDDFEHHCAVDCEPVAVSRRMRSFVDGVWELSRCLGSGRTRRITFQGNSWAMDECR